MQCCKISEIFKISATLFMLNAYLHIISHLRHTFITGSYFTMLRGVFTLLEKLWVHKMGMHLI